MHTSGIEDLKLAIRRSAWLIVALVVLGVVAMNVVKQLDGPQYQASGRILLSSTDLAASLAGIQSVYVDPERRDDAEANLANSPPLYDFTARRAGGTLGTGPDLAAATSASADNNVVKFVATSDNPRGARSVANAVTSSYPAWRAKILGNAIDIALEDLQAQSTTGASGDLADELRRLQLQKTLITSDTLLVTPATSASKTTPNVSRDTMLGATLGLIVAFLIAGARELFNTRIRSEGEVEEILGAPVLATVHRLPRSLRHAVVGGSNARATDEYDLLAATLRQMFDGHEGTVLIAVTSAIPGEGKTTTTANLASALARRGQSVVLADFDLRNSRLTELFSIPKGAPGVSDLLSGHARLDSILWSVSLNGDGAGNARTPPELVTAQTRRRAARRENTGTLTVLPGGRSSTRSSSSKFAQLPDLLTQINDADFVVIDTPPALLISGMVELGQSVDATLVVVRHGVVTRRQLRSLGQQAQSWRPKLIGAVFNDTPRQESERGYGGYYGRA